MNNSLQAALDEAAWCAIALGGAPVKTFYQECQERMPNISAQVDIAVKAGEFAPQ